MVGCSFAWNWDFFPFLELWKAYKHWGFQNFGLDTAKTPMMWDKVMWAVGATERSLRSAQPSLSFPVPAEVPMPSQYCPPHTQPRDSLEMGVGGLEDV